MAAPHPGRPVRRRARDPVVVARPAAGRGRPAAQRGHGHPRLRRVRQHGRDRRRADPDGGGQGRRARRSSSASRTSVVIGVVAFSDSGLVGPGADQRPGAGPRRHRRGSQPQRGTSLGQGILASLDAIAAPRTTRRPDYYSQPVARRRRRRRRRSRPGTHTSAVIVLLTDGENNVAPDPLAAAAGRRRPRRPHLHGRASAAPPGTTLELDGFTVHTQLDEATLQQIADRTGGTYFSAADAGRPARRSTTSSTPGSSSEAEQMEVTSLFAGAGVLLLALGGLASAPAGSGGCHDGLIGCRIGGRDELALAGRTRAPPGLAAFVVGLVVLRRRRRPPAVRYSSLSLVRARVARLVAPPAPPAVRAVLLALAAWSSPSPGRSPIVSVPTGQTTIILAIDVSRSMCSTDIPPSRLLAAETAAADVHRAPGRDAPRSASSRSPASPSWSRRRRSDQEVLLDAVASLTTGRRTAVGSAS